MQVLLNLGVPDLPVAVDLYQQAFELSVGEGYELVGIHLGENDAQY